MNTSIRQLVIQLFLPVYLPGILTAMAQTSVLVLLPMYVLELGFDASIAALMLASRGVGQLLGDVPAGIVASKFGDRGCLLLGNIGYVIGYSLMACGNNPILLGIGGIIAGLSMSFALLGRQAYISHRSLPNQRGRALSLVAGGMRIGSLIGPVIGGLVASHYSYQVAFLCMVALSVLALVLVLMTAEKGQPEATDTPHSMGAILRILVDHKQAFLSAGLAMIMLQFMRAGRITLLPLAGSSVGLNVAEVGFLVSAAAFMDSLMFVPAGIIMDRWGRKAAAAPSLIIFALGLSLLAWADSYAALLAGALLIGTGNGLSAGLVMVLGVDFAPEKGRARFIGVWKLVSDSGQAAAPLVISGMLTVTSLLVTTQAVAMAGFFGFYWLRTRVQETLQKTEGS
ncbi:MFS transporter [Oceanobacter kriegii]|uniref:MFS transporter n=1 Tax=Oceanobacter kriegii TaxID=64972 RepID=UPI000420918F|nr:MFS transporter [Oceanobacter kriegii]